MKRIILVLIVGLVITSCTSTQQTTEQKPKEQEIYVFDDANVKNAKDTVKAAVEKVVTEKAAEQVVKEPIAEVKKEIPVLKEMNYIVQLGAFSSKEKAEKFVSENKSKLNYELRILFSEAVKLFVVQLPPYATKEEAEKVRNKLWETAVFKDAFIVTNEKK